MARHGETDLYRFYDADDKLLYIGISYNHFRRFKQHSRQKPWIKEVSCIKIERFKTRFAAEAAEEEYITNESPKYNIDFKGGRSNKPVKRPHSKIKCPIQRQLDQGGVAFLAAGHAAKAYPALWTVKAAEMVWSRDMPAAKSAANKTWSRHMPKSGRDEYARDIANRQRLIVIKYRIVNGRKDMTALVDATTVDKAREMLLAVMPDARIIEIEPPMA